jgi:signal transduction histidine kinase
LTQADKRFFDRDMYMFALDRNGTYLAFGGNQAKVGTRVQDIAGIDGEGLVDAIIAQANLEPGWVEYDITNPASGRVQTKMSFVRELDDLYIGCGVYKNPARTDDLVGSGYGVPLGAGACQGGLNHAAFFIQYDGVGVL